jgi:hypothetical protein
LNVGFGEVKHKFMRSSGTVLAIAFEMVNFMTQKKTEPGNNQTRGLLIAGASLLLLFGVAFLKGRAK